MCFLLQLFQPKSADSESASSALCSAKDPLNQASWKRSALSPNTDSWNFGARKAVSEAPQVEMQQVGISWAAMLHIKKEGPKMTLPKLKLAWYSNCGCFSQGLCQIYWMVVGSAINRSVSVFNPIASIKTQKRYLQNSSASGGKSVATALEIFFSKLVLSTVSHIFVATKLQS